MARSRTRLRYWRRLRPSRSSSSERSIAATSAPKWLRTSGSWTGTSTGPSGCPGFTSLNLTIVDSREPSASLQCALSRDYLTAEMRANLSDAGGENGGGFFAAPEAHLALDQAQVAERLLERFAFENPECASDTGCARPYRPASRSR